MPIILLCLILVHTISCILKSCKGHISFLSRLYTTFMSSRILAVRCCHVFFLLKSRKQNHLFLLTHFNFVVRVARERKNNSVRKVMDVGLGSDTNLPLIHSLSGCSWRWLTGNLGLFSFMSHHSHHCHLHAHAHTNRQQHSVLHTCRLLAWSRHEVTARIITTIERGYICFPQRTHLNRV